MSDERSDTWERSFLDELGVEDTMGRRFVRDMPLVSDPSILRGRVVFEDTRVPVDLVFCALAEGLSVDEILEVCPMLSRFDLLTVLREAGRRIGLRPGEIV
jgi:uncharacterized protein (DUF433 family)